MKYASKRWTTVGVKGLAAIVPTLIPTLMFFVAFPRRVTADPGGCFMETSSGKTISLGQLCGVTPVSDGIIRIPIKRRVGRTPVVDVTFNGQRTYEMIFDTGASSSLITMIMASDMKLKSTGVLQAQIADGSQVQFMTTKVNSISVGGMVASNLEVAIAPRADIGLLGHDFFGNYDVKILEKVVELYPR
jgi:predicted aspartyl protease